MVVTCRTTIDAKQLDASEVMADQSSGKRRAAFEVSRFSGFFRDIIGLSANLPRLSGPPNKVSSYGRRNPDDSGDF